MPLDLALTNYNQRTGRYNLARANNGAGDVAFDQTQAYAAHTSVACQRNGWWADRNLGSDLYLLKSATQRTPSIAEAMVLAALARLTQLRLISASPTAQARLDKSTGINRLLIDFRWRTPAGISSSGVVPV